MAVYSAMLNRRDRSSPAKVVNKPLTLSRKNPLLPTFPLQIRSLKTSDAENHTSTSRRTTCWAAGRNCALNGFLEFMSAGRTEGGRSVTAVHW